MTKSFARGVSSTAGKRRPRRVLWWGLLALIGWFPLSWLAAHLLIVKSDLTRADAIVVMSGSSTYVERADRAAQLYREGRAPLILLTNDHLISGWDKVQERNPFFYELAARELQKRGVPPEKIQIINDSGYGTYEESLGVREYATEHKIKSLLVVTSSYHTRRAFWSMRLACEGSGIELCVDSPPPGWQTPTEWSWWRHRWGWRVVAGEYGKMLYYWWRY